MLTYLKGAGLTAGLIISLGPQNLELIRLGLNKQPAFTMATVFIVCDIILIAIGASSFGSIIAMSNNLIFLAQCLTIAFLCFLASQTFRRAFTWDCLKNDNVIHKKNTIKRGLALSFLNPLAVLETVILVGSASAQYPLSQRLWFISGSLSISIVWFYAMAIISSRVANIFSSLVLKRSFEYVAGIILVGMALVFFLNLGKI